MVWSENVNYKWIHVDALRLKFGPTRITWIVSQCDDMLSIVQRFLSLLSCVHNKNMIQYFNEDFLRNSTEFDLVLEDLYCCSVLQLQQYISRKHFWVSSTNCLSGKFWRAFVRLWIEKYNSFLCSSHWPNDWSNCDSFQFIYRPLQQSIWVGNSKKYLWTYWPVPPWERRSYFLKASYVSSFICLWFDLEWKYSELLPLLVSKMNHSWMHGNI